MNEQSLAENVRRIRLLRGLSQAALAERAGVSRETIRSIEGAESSPRFQTLVSVATALGVEATALFEHVQRLGLVRFRSDARLASRESVLSRVGAQLERYEALERLLLEPRKDLSAVQRRIASAGGAPAEAASLARESFGLGASETIRDICGLLEDNGIKVLTPSVATDGFFGLSVGFGDGGPAIAVNVWDRITVERWIFTAAHELGHLLLHLSAFNVAETREDEQEERAADTFAAHFLMPAAVFASEYGEARGLPFYDRVMKLKRMFRVSYRSVLYRIGENVAPEHRAEIWKRFFAEHAARGLKELSIAEEPDGLTAEDFRRPSEKPAEEPQGLVRADFVQDRLRRLVRRALEEQKIDPAEAAGILETSSADVAAMLDAWDPLPGQ